MIAARIENGVVTDVAACTARDRLPPEYIKTEQRVGIGWTHSRGIFAPPAPLARPAPTTTDVNLERQRRRHGGFTFRGNLFDSDPESLTNISGAATLAGFAMFAGAQPGDLQWHRTADNPTPPPFRWITKDNQIVTMDAPTVFALGQAAAHWVSGHTFAARSIKDLPAIPKDYKDPTRWPM